MQILDTSLKGMSNLNWLGWLNSWVDTAPLTLIRAQRPSRAGLLCLRLRMLVVLDAVQQPLSSRVWYVGSGLGMSRPLREGLATHGGKSGTQGKGGALLSVWPRNTVRGGQVGSGHAWRDPDPWLVQQETMMGQMLAQVGPHLVESSTDQLVMVGRKFGWWRKRECQE